MKKNLKEEKDKYFISLDTHMNDIRGYEEKLEDYQRIIKRLKNENQELENANKELNNKIVEFFKSIM